ncbi:MAG TPA: hypothetical protein VFG56_00075, partial [Candidatus Saccharimonadales bacterium]|nr:hypothetical protein [Candidatus Saccharimonadales bacterium]
NHFIEPDTTGWASLIENGKADQIDLTEITTAVRDGADVIVLACTHYLALQDQLCRLAPKATIIEPTEAIAAQIKRLMSQLGRQTAGRDRHNF